MKLNIARIERDSMVDGPGGPRTVVWLQGCSVRCYGCQNWALWPAETSDMLSLDPTEAADLVLRVANGQPITVTGGEPFDQTEALAKFVHRLKSYHLTDEGYHAPLNKYSESPHIIVYTGRYLETVLAPLYKEPWGDEQPIILSIMGNIDVLVDGPYVRPWDNDYMQWRGSYNQRVIDVRNLDILDKAGLANPPILDWDTPALEIVGSQIYATGGLIEELGLDTLGVLDRAPRCGQHDRD